MNPYVSSMLLLNNVNSMLNHANEYAKPRERVCSTTWTGMLNNVSGMLNHVKTNLDEGAVFSASKVSLKCVGWQLSNNRPPFFNFNGIQLITLTCFHYNINISTMVKLIH